MWKSICRTMRTAVIDIRDDKIRRLNQRHRTMNTNSGEYYGYDGDRGVSNAP